MNYKMKRIFLLFLTACLLLTSCQRLEPTDAPVSETQADTGGDGTAGVPEHAINVMSFNLYGINMMTTAKNDASVEIDGTVATRGPKLNALLRGEQIDIAGLQEASAPWREWMMTGLDKDYGFTGYTTRDTGEGGIVLYRRDKFRVIDNGAFWLTYYAPTEPDKSSTSNFDRMCTWVIFRVLETDDVILFMDTHLDTVAEARPEQAEVVIRQMQKLKKDVETRMSLESCPVILVGDMNARLDEIAYQVMVDNMKDARRNSLGDTVNDFYSTSPGYRYYPQPYYFVRDGHVIDHIFVTENITVYNYKMLQTSSNHCEYGTFISDHNAIIAKIFWNIKENET